MKRLVGLRHRRARAAEAVALVEGTDELARAVEAGATVREAYRRVERPDEAPDSLAAALAVAGAEVVDLGPEAFARVAVRDTAGWVAVVADPTVRLADLDLPIEPLLLVVEAGEKPGNLGAMLRTADAVGVDAVVVADPVTDVTNPNVVRSSLGCVFTVPVAVADAEETVAWLAERDIPVTALLVDAGTVLWEADLTGPLAVAVGAEHEGLSRVWWHAERPVRIPMAGVADSLNASVAAAVVLYEAARQRSIA